MAALGRSTMLPDRVQTQPRRSSHADSVTNQILQASANFQNLSQSRYPLLLLLRNYSLLPSPLTYSDPNSRNSRLSGRYCQSVEHKSPNSDKLASRTVLGPVCLCSVRLKTECLKRRPAPLPPHQAPRRNTRKDEESIGQTKPTHA